MPAADTGLPALQLSASRPEILVQVCGTSIMYPCPWAAAAAGAPTALKHLCWHPGLAEPARSMLPAADFHPAAHCTQAACHKHLTSKGLSC